MSTALADAVVVMGRNLRRIPRQPDLLVAFTIQPVMFVLLFVYVFGGAIRTPGLAYVDFLMPGIIVQSIAFGGFLTALGLAEDLGKGLIDRFRSLPMARSAVLAGRTLTDVVMNALSVTIMVVVGIIAGFSFRTSVPEVVLGLFLLLLFGYAFSWMFALIGMSVSTPESANGVGFVLVFPLTFASSAFVPVNTMPQVLRAFAKVNPFTVEVDAIRHLFVGTPAGSSVWGAAAWSVGLIVIFAPLAVAKYRRVATR
jgi:ABC transporter DrrB family efflux protein